MCVVLVVFLELSGWAAVAVVLVTEAVARLAGGVPVAVAAAAFGWVGAGEGDAAHEADAEEAEDGETKRAAQSLLLAWAVCCLAV